VEWNGKDPGGAPIPSGQYWITATWAGDRARSCQTRMLVQVTSTLLDTLIPPPPLDGAQLLPETADRRTGPAAFAGAVVLGAAAFALPAISPDADPAPSYAVGGVLGVTGVVGLVRYRSGNQIPENAAANAITRARWQREVDRVAAVNLERRKESRLEVRASPAVLLGCDGQ
jgi:hypothetical protein